MKNTTLIIAFLFISLVSFAQEKETYVEVAGQAAYQMKVESYQIKFEINGASSFNKADEKSGLEELKAHFFQRAKELGIERNRFRIAEKNLFDTKRITDDRIKLLIDTDSKEELLKILSLDTLGRWVYKTGQKVIYKPFTSENEVVVQALENARKQAVIVAAAMDKKPGKVLVITDYNFVNEFSKSSYTPLKERTYRIRVRFAVE